MDKSSDHSIRKINDIQMSKLVDVKELMKSNEQYMIDNNILYKKILDMENEIRELKNIVKKLTYLNDIENKLKR